MSSSEARSLGERVRSALRNHEKDRSGQAAAPAGLERFEILEPLGEGAVAVVHRARDRQLGRDVALKLLREPLGLNAEVRDRFEREAKIAAGLSHPNLISVFDAGEAAGRLYLVMERVEGRPLGDLLRGRKMEPREAARLLEKIARGLEAAHQRGIVHRDLKPANIIVTWEGEPKIGDFGLAHIVGSDVGLTRSGAVLGTPLYMAPEQVSGHSGSTGPATDVYALGAILYEALTGGPPHQGMTVTELYGRILGEEVVPPRRLNPDLPRELQNVCLKALEKVTSRRYESAGRFADDLQRFLQGEPVLARSVSGIERLWRKVSRLRAMILPAAVAIPLALWGASAIRSGMAASAKAGNEREALKLLEEARRPLDDALLYLYDPDARHGELVDRAAAAQRLIERAVDRAPDLAQGHHLLGLLWEIQGWEDRAVACWRTAIAKDPTFAASRFELGRLLIVRAYLSSLGANRGTWKERRASMKVPLDEAASHLRIAGGSLSGPQQDLAKALEAYARDDEARMLEILAGAFARHGKVRGTEDLHWVAGFLGDDAGQIAACTKTLGIRPKHPIALFLRGNARQGTGDLDGAEDDYGLALEIRPRMVSAWANRGIARLEQGHFNEAVDDFNRAIELDARHAGAYYNRAQARGRLGDLPGSVDDSTAVIRIDPSFLEAYVNRASVLLRLERPAEALSDLDHALRNAPPGWPSRPLAAKLQTQARQALRGS